MAARYTLACENTVRDQEAGKGGAKDHRGNIVKDWGLYNFQIVELRRKVNNPKVMEIIEYLPQVGTE